MTRGGRILRVAAIVVGLLLIVAGGVAYRVRAQLRGSLPALDGTIPIEGLAAAVTVERDANGVPTIAATTRADAFRALGFVHAQERFFQMDLQRRQAAGELAELFGAAAVGADRASRFHRFRARARERLAEALPEHRALLEAYAAGVDAGLDALDAPPPEYVLLRKAPRPWAVEDAYLTIYAMYFSLQDSRGTIERRRHLLRTELPLPLARFLDPPGTGLDAALDGSEVEVAPVPPANVFDLRRPEQLAHATRPYADAPVPGSNAFAVGASASVDGAARVAGDMHLPIGMPNLWFRAVVTYPEADGRTRRLAGITLPGTPALVAGSNGDVAWAFTNADGDWLDLARVEFDGDDRGRYRVGGEFEPVVEHRETIVVDGADPVEMTIRETRWGPLIAEDDLGTGTAVAWVAHRPFGAHFRFLRLASAADLDGALAIAADAGIPAQNFNAVDRAGRVGWSIAGPIPRRVGGLDGRAPSFWAPDGPRWDGVLPPADYPRWTDPDDGRIWSANQRMIGGEALAKLGRGRFDLGARAGQIRDGLRALDVVGRDDLLAIQLDDRARFLERWRALLLDTLDDAAVATFPRRLELRDLVRDGWSGRAAVDDAAYRMVRAFRLFAAERILDPIVAPCRDVDEDFALRGISQWEGPLWTLIEERPEHLLAPEYDSWRDALLASADAVLAEFEGPLASHTWGERNRVAIRHPLSRAVPQLAGWLDIETESLPGDAHMPRVQSGSFGATQRMVVSPGREEEGIWQMPGGQSGHPLSPYYRAGHRDWAEGRPTPFLPGETVHRLTLEPAASM